MPSASRFHPDFSRDVSDGTDYYDNISRGLGDRFRGNVRQMLVTIRQRPESFGYVASLLRAAVVPGFPYVIFFRISDGTIHFIALFHAASNPERWSQREDESETG